MAGERRSRGRERRNAAADTPENAECQKAERRTDVGQSGAEGAREKGSGTTVSAGIGKCWWALRQKEKAERERRDNQPSSPTQPLIAEAPPPLALTAPPSCCQNSKGVVRRANFENEERMASAGLSRRRAPAAVSTAQDDDERPPTSSGKTSFGNLPPIRGNFLPTWQNGAIGGYSGQYSPNCYGWQSYLAWGACR
ncbi:hypothetical protein C8R45DRAFT_933526 [Mycena sanguinolenta]|nr:hypothetical protein C8R45DRAFT_933526 [Mycena sanguinolenta]